MHVARQGKDEFCKAGVANVYIPLVSFPTSSRLRSFDAHADVQCCATRPALRNVIHMEIATQLSVFLANKPGTLAKVCDELAKHKINIYALTISDTVDHAVVRMVVSQEQTAIHLLESRGVLVVENSVIMMENSNQPGSLSKIANTLAKAKVNIEYAYLATRPGENKGLLIIRASDTKKAFKVLSKK